MSVGVRHTSVGRSLAARTSWGSLYPATAHVAAERAAAWCRYLKAHARRLYATVTDRVRVAATRVGGAPKATVAAALLASRIARGRLAKWA